MWHEARKQERKIRGIMVDYKKRAERRRDFYEKIVSFNFTIAFFSVYVCVCVLGGGGGGILTDYFK
jgi:hypothetical protein